MSKLDVTKKTLLKTQSHEQNYKLLLSGKTPKSIKILPEAP